MHHDLQGKNVVTAGRFKTFSRDDLHRAIRIMGGRVRDTVRPNTHFLIAEGSSQEVQAAQRRAPHGCTLLDEQTFGALYQEHRRQHREQRHILPNHEVLTEFRDLLYDTPTLETWLALVKLLDATATGLLPTAVDYILPHQERWATPALGDHAPLPQPLPHEHLDPLTLTWRSPWRPYVHNGEDSTKYRLLRSLGIYGKLQGAALTRILKLPALSGLREIHFKGTQQKAALATYKALATGFPRLHTLTLRRVTPRLAQELCAPGALPSLRYLTLSHSRHNATQGPIGYQALMDAPWWPQIEGLGCAMRPDLSGDPAQRNQVYQAMAARPEQLTGLKHLMLGDDCDPTPLFEAGLFQGQIRRLSVSDSQMETFTQCLEHLDSAPDHSVRVLDMARVIPHYFNDKNLLPERQDRAAARILQLTRPELLEGLTLDPHYLSPERLEQLQGLAREANIKITHQSWRDPH